MTTWTIALPPGYSPDRRLTLFQCGANARMNRMQRHRITKQIRTDTKLIASAMPPITVPVKILAVQHPTLLGRACDAENIAPQVKAMIDGLRDAKVLADDTRRYVTEVRTIVGDPRPGSQLVLHLIEDTDDEPESEAA